MRSLYNFLFYLALPFVVARLIWRSLRQPAYRHRLPERFGFYPFKLEKSVWVHAVSVGEVMAAVPLINLLKNNDLPIVITTMTPTGAAQVKAIFGESVIHAYVPYDMTGAVRRFFTAASPLISIILETELWPNLLAACRAHSIPVCLMNARLSEKSAKAYGRIAHLTREMLQGLAIIAAQGQKDAERLIALGVAKERVVVTGNIKFDLTLPEDLAAKSKALRNLLGQDRFVWIAASTHEGEEAIVLAAHQLIRAADPNALLILVPRHPDRFEMIAKTSAQQFVTIKRTQPLDFTPETAVYVGDTMGELLLMYGAADVAFIGGSLVARGGHNLLEPAALAKPLLSGTHLFNFAEISELFIAAKALTQVYDAPSLAEQVIKLRQNAKACKEQGEQALSVMRANRGSLMKQWQLIVPLLEQALHSGNKAVSPADREQNQPVQ